MYGTGFRTPQGSPKIEDQKQNGKEKEFKNIKVYFNKREDYVKIKMTNE